MTPNTLTEMIAGFAVIVGLLLLYILSLVIRTVKARSKYHEQHPE